ncbi:MAG: hypothetical protein ACRDK2_11090 [Solirubrobacteraceae bacterium]
MSEQQPYEREQAERAASEAAHIGGEATHRESDPAMVPVEEGGGGESEGFEQAEELLIEHATHGDQQSAHAVLHDQSQSEEEDSREDGEADHERREDDESLPET